MKPLLPIAALIALAMLLGYGLFAGLPSAPSGVRVGQEFPAFQLPALMGEEILSRKNLPQKPFLLNIWGSWCPGCLVEHAYLVSLAEQGIPLVCLNYLDDSKKAIAWLTNQGDPCLFHIADKSGQLALDLGVTGAPETFLVDGDGIIRHHHLGIMDEKVWQQQFLPLMASVSP